MQNGDETMPIDEIGDERDEAGATTRRDLLRAVGATALGVVAASLTVEQSAHARYKKRHLYTATRSGHIPIGMVVHSNADPGSGGRLQTSGHVTVGDIAVLTVIQGTKYSTPKQYDIYFEDLEQSLDSTDPSYANFSNPFTITIASGEDIGQASIKTGNPTDVEEVVFVMKSSDYRRYSTHLKIHAKPVP